MFDHVGSLILIVLHYYQLKSLQSYNSAFDTGKQWTCTLCVLTLFSLNHASMLLALGATYS
jgi:hypothetical protein